MGAPGAKSVKLLPQRSKRTNRRVEQRADVNIINTTTTMRGPSPIQDKTDTVEKIPARSGPFELEFHKSANAKI